MLVKMQRDGHMVDVHPSMVDDYKSGGYSVIEEKPKKRGRPRKVKNGADN